MEWYEMPETSEEERARKEISECNYCINRLIGTMREMGVPEKDWGNNVMIKEYIERMEKAKKVLKN